MMTSFFFLFFSIFIFLSMYMVENPLNLSMKLVFLTILLFSLMNLGSSSWFSMILIMLILGGILVIFSILSSLMPNEKMKKEKGKMFFFSLIFTFFFLSPKIFHSSVYKFTKSFIEELPVFLMILIIMLFYFFSFISFLSIEETPMRKFSCFW